MSDVSLFRMVGAARSRLVDRVVDEIERLILGGQLVPGTKLPPEREFGEQLGVSRTVTREAVQVLVTKGMLESKPGVGTIVRQVTPSQVAEPLSLLLRTRKGGVRFEDLHHVRCILEIEVAGCAAERATPAEIADLEATFRAMEAAGARPDAAVAADAAFHSALAQMTHNAVLEILSESIRDLLRQYLLLVLPHLDLERDVLPFHRRILERVKARDREGARLAMEEHLEQIRRNHQAVFGRQPAGGSYVDC